MHWVIQNNFMHESGWDVMVETLKRFSIPYSLHKVVPFVGDLLPDIDISNDRVICMGSYSMRHVAKKKGWTPGVFDLFDVDFRIQMEHWGRLMLNADSKVFRFQDARIDRPTFIRPIDDSKYFAGRVFEPAEFLEWQRKVCVLEEDFGTSLTKDTLIQLSEPKNILGEARFWIVNDRIVSSSMYKVGDRVIYSPQVDWRYTERALSACTPMSVDYWRPADAYVLDVCELAGGATKIVEINTINSAGFYAGHVQDIVLALNGGFE